MQAFRNASLELDGSGSLCGVVSLLSGHTVALKKGNSSLGRFG